MYIFKTLRREILEVDVCSGALQFKCRQLSEREFTLTVERLPLLFCLLQEVKRNLPKMTDCKNNFKNNYNKILLALYTL